MLTPLLLSNLKELLMIKYLAIPPPVFWAQMRCWGLCLLVLALWGGIGIAGLFSPLLLGSSLQLWSWSVPMYLMPLAFCAVVVRHCVKDWQVRLLLNASGIEQWTRNRYAVEADDEHLDAFSCELESLSTILAVGKPRWFVSARKGLSIKVYAPAAATKRPAILITSDMLTAGFSAAGRRTLLAHELAHVLLRTYLFDMFCASVNIVAWSGLLMGALFLHAYMGWHLLLLALIIPSVCWLASSLGDMVAALINRIHEDSCDRIADIVVGPGSVAATLLHLLHVQLKCMKEGDKQFFDRHRQAGFFGALRYLRGELLAEHPHELARIAKSRKT